MPGRDGPEGLQDRQGPRDEIDLGLEQVDEHLRAEVATQRCERLEPGDPAAGDDDPRHQPGGTEWGSTTARTDWTAFSTSILMGTMSRSGRTSGARGAPPRIAR